MDALNRFMNSNPVTKRIVFKAEAVLATPALIGSGESDKTDSDVLVDGLGAPFLPGTSLAGVLRALLNPNNPTPKNKGEDKTNDKETKPPKKTEREILLDELFGEIEDDGVMSAIWVLDSVFKNAEGDQATVVELDGVAIDSEDKVAIDEKKYDFEAVETGSRFTIRIMLVIREKNNSQALEDELGKIAFSLLNGNVSIGAKTNRGFGSISCDKVLQQVFDFENNGIATLERWIKFDWEEATNDWRDATLVEHNPPYNKLEACLKLDGSIMIRDDHNPEEDEDYKHICSGGSDNPVIFGTSWAGAIRNGLYRLLKPVPGWEDKTSEKLNLYFGKVVEGTQETVPSLIAFDASFLKPDDRKTDGYRKITRVKIDRFTGGAANGALFTERPWYGGQTKLTARWDPRGENSAEIEKLLLLALDAINNGLLTVGGETSVGRGVFKVLNREIYRADCQDDTERRDNDE